MNKYKNIWQLMVLTLVCTILGGGSAFGARVADVRGTLHNLSSAPDGTATPSGGTVPSRNIKATTEDQICVFCHTPHAASAGAKPLWNRTLSSATYTVYTSSSLDSEVIKGGPLDQPGGSSKLCLSCHDGTLAIGNVNVLDGRANQTIAMSGGPNMPAGSGTTTGFTRNLGTDLTNDHPISVNYTNAFAVRDGEYRQVDANQKWPNGTGEIIGVRSPGSKPPKVPLERPAGGGDAQIQCATCHDPHIRETDASVGNQKFLRLNRFQAEQPSSTATTFDTTKDIICLACHEKSGDSWAYSAHANSQVATPTYTAAAASQRQFPAALPVWKAACLNCHDTHTVQGSRRLLREGTDSAATPKAGGGPAIEETCYQCHTSDASKAAITPLTNVPAIKQDFALPRHMPITTADQSASTEVHDISVNTNDAGGVNCTTMTSNKCGADLVETRAKLGLGNLDNRHAECTDCHNPHRVVKFQDFRGAAGSGSLAGAPDSAGTHKHTDDANTQHTNLASGVLRGAFGVEPVYTSPSFYVLPASFDVKRGDPGTNTNTDASATYVTREYQICLKCHSNYGYSDNNGYYAGLQTYISPSDGKEHVDGAIQSTNRPALGSSGGGTPSGTNDLQYFTNQAREFQAPATHKGDKTNGAPGDSGASSSFSTNNHRGWHPVIGSTGRTPTERASGAADDFRLNTAEAFVAPWGNNVGNQTMYCTDCHGSNTASTTVIPTGSNPWGPHGSTNNFLLKGNWNKETGHGNAADGVCFKCHNYDNYANGDADNGHDSSGYSGSNQPGCIGHQHNYHQAHAYYYNGKKMAFRCQWCHVAVPHGWKNKQLLVNLNDVGPEVGLPAGTEVFQNTLAGYVKAPYYNGAILKIKQFAKSGNWDLTNCGSAKNDGKGWMNSGDGCGNLQ